ncbi:MAG: glycosyltransferase family 2 protein [bacterium]|nr:glycosyltransferase family 2 protein [bacterium]
MTHLHGSIAVIPVHNEAATIATIVAAACAYVPVIVVDDASDDDSAQHAAAAGAKVIRLSQQRGKGIALRQGLTAALQRGADRIVTLDGDGQHDPDDIPRLLAASYRRPDSMIIGGRLQAAATIPRHRLHAIRLASFWLNWMGNCDVQDTQSGFRVYPATILHALDIKRGGFLFESESLLKAAQAGYNIYELPINTVYQAERKSQFRPIRDGISIASYLSYRGLRYWPRQIGCLFAHRKRDASNSIRRTRQRICATALATSLLPVLLLALIIQCLVGRMGYDVLAPIIQRFYDQRLLHTPAVDRETAHAL